MIYEQEFHGGITVTMGIELISPGEKQQPKLAWMRMLMMMMMMMMMMLMMLMTTALAIIV